MSAHHRNNNTADALKGIPDYEKAEELKGSVFTIKTYNNFVHKPVAIHR